MEVLQEAMDTLGIDLCKEVATATYTPFVGKLKGTAWAPVPHTMSRFAYAVGFGIKVHDITRAYANTCVDGEQVLAVKLMWGWLPMPYMKTETRWECQQRLQANANGETYKWGIDMKYWWVGEMCESTFLGKICWPWPVEKSESIISVDGHGTIRFFLQWLWG